MKKVFLLLLAMVLVFSFSLITGCEKAQEKAGELKEGAMEKAGEMKEDAMEKAGELKEEAMEKAGEMKEKTAGYGEPKAPGYDKAKEAK
jgi:hypothetical protein